MRNIHPASALDNYKEIIGEVTVGKPVFLEVDGVVKYAILDMKDYDKTQAIIKLFSELMKGESSAEEAGYISISDVDSLLSDK